MDKICNALNPLLMEKTRNCCSNQNLFQLFILLILLFIVHFPPKEHGKTNKHELISIIHFYSDMINHIQYCISCILKKKKKNQLMVLIQLFNYFIYIIGYPNNGFFVIQPNSKCEQTRVHILSPYPHVDKLVLVGNM